MEQVTLPPPIVPVEDRSAWQCPTHGAGTPLRLFGSTLHCVLCGEQCEPRPSVIAAQRHAARVVPTVGTVRGAPPARNGCYDRPASAPPYFAQDGYEETVDQGWGTFHRTTRYIEVEHVMSEDCQYSEHTVAPKCAGCRWNKQEASK